MARDLKELFREASKLPEHDRATLAGLLLESIEPQRSADVEAAWSLEIERRVREIESGSVDLVDWEEVRATLFDFDK